MAKTVRLFTGASMPTIGLGTWLSKPGEVEAAVIAAVECGYRHIDCAAFYGNEREVGDGLADVIARGIVRREDMFITSKLWCQDWYRPAAALAKTLADLRTPYVDLYLPHWPQFISADSQMFPPKEECRLGYSPAAYLAVWRELEKEVDAGRVRHLGGSNLSAKKLTALLSEARIRPAANQIELHPNFQQQVFVNWMARQGIVATAFSPLGSPDRPARLRADDDPASPLSHPSVLAIAEAHSVSAGQVRVM
jgi:alcohol dehydrogenase (NADP+)